MAENPFDQFDEAPSGNPFDQFDERPRPKWTENIWGSGEIDTPGEKAGVVIGDVLQAGAAGLANTRAALLGAPGSVGEYMDRGYEKLGLIPEGTVDELGRIANPITSSTMQSDLSRLTSGDTDYQAQTVPGRIAGMVGDFKGGGATGREALFGGTASELAGMATEGTPYETPARIAAGMLGPVIANKLQGAVSPMGGRIEPNRQTATELLRQSDPPINPSAGQVAGPIAGQDQLYRESATIAGRQIVQDADDAYSAVVMRSIGSNSPTASPVALGERYRAMGDVFEAATQVGPMTANRTQATVINRLKSAGDDLVQGTSLPPLMRKIDDAVAASSSSGASIPPDVVLNWRSNLSLLRTSSDPGVRQTAIDMLDVVDDIIEVSAANSGQSAIVDALRDVRRQYRNFLVIERAAQRAPGGVLTPKAVRTALLSVEGRRGYTQALGDLSPVTQAATDVLERLPQSGTAPRRASTEIFQNATAGGATGGAAHLLGLPPIPAVALGVATAAAPVLKNQFASSPLGQRYFLNQLMQRVAPTKQSVSRLAGAGLLSQQE